ncbi:LuxR family transcriptional regulator [Streptomyces sp. ACA25]|uniref:helix-turn-helix transcriptional regulator n=1 Tax=Streptomyces sp. ACA25 TaxID=3022596 RepID=UPI002307A3F1|nr:LuxR family transcriptional regulator [Streptomyces sp. ACA25]MDB1086596.1 LuxR family transcriptional regulator [Streptomyces sp. ACA25]
MNESLCAVGDGQAYGDEVEYALLQARQLIESTVSLHRNGPSAGSLVPLPAEEEAALEVIRGMIGGARHTISISVPGDSLSYPHAATVLSLLRAAGQRGVVIRALCSARALGTDELRSLVRAEPDWAFRVAGDDLHDALVVDSRVALVFGGPDRTAGPGSVIEDLATVRTLDLLMAGTWQAAVPPSVHQGVSPYRLSLPAQQVLTELRTGRTDEVAAAELDMSLRTYRRHVAEIMSALGAASRFQAGFRAVELGLLPKSG